MDWATVISTRGGGEEVEVEGDDDEMDACRFEFDDDRAELFFLELPDTNPSLVRGDARCPLRPIGTQGVIASPN